MSPISDTAALPAFQWSIPNETACVLDLLNGVMHWIIYTQERLDRSTVWGSKCKLQGLLCRVKEGFIRLNGVAGASDRPFLFNAWAITMATDGNSVPEYHPVSGSYRDTVWLVWLQFDMLNNILDWALSEATPTFSKFSFRASCLTYKIEILCSTNS